MYRLLIVDDEPIIADGLFDEFQFYNQIELDVYKAYSGRAALELLNRTRIDIVITDIRMPGIDGIELLEKIRSHWPQCKVIFLTGHREFDYAYKALQHKGVEYILKTEGYGKVIKAVENAIVEIEESMKAVDLINKANEQLNTTNTLLQNDYLMSLLRGKEAEIKLIRPELKRLGINLLVDAPFLMLIGRVDHLPENLPYSEKTKNFYTINLIADQFLYPLVNCVHVTDENFNLIWLIQPKQFQAGDELQGTAMTELWESTVLFVKETLETIQKSCKDTLGRTISFAINTVPTEWSGIAESFTALKHLIDYRIGRGEEMLLTDKNIERQEAIPCIFNEYQKPRFKTNKLEKLELHLERGEKEDFTLLLDDISESFTSVISKHYSPALEIYYSIAMMLMSYINRWNLVEKISFRIGLYKLLRADEHTSWPEAADYLKQLTVVIFEIQKGEQEKRAVNTINRICEYIDGHLYEELSLVKLADLVYFNPSYLSRLFKQLTGANLSEYIQEARIKKAKQLLAKHDMRVNDIAVAVGYGSATNFTRFFKKVTSMTPQEYRESLSTGKGENQK